MEYVKLGKSDLKVSRLCLGCMSFGEVKPGMNDWVLNQEQTDEMIKRALDLGINFFDTANLYSSGTSETFIGNSFKKLVKNRKDIVAEALIHPCRYEDGTIDNHFTEYRITQSDKLKAKIEQMGYEIGNYQ